MSINLEVVPLRDEPLDPLSERDVVAAKILASLRERDDTATRLAHGWLAPIEVARVAAEVTALGGVPKSSTFILVKAQGESDYYEGELNGLYRDGRLIWSGYSDDAVDDIVSAVVGSLDLERRTTTLPRQPGVYSSNLFPELLSDLPDG